MYVEAVRGFSQNGFVSNGRRQVRQVTPVKPHVLTGRSTWRIECARLPSMGDILVFAALVSLKGCDPCIGHSVAFINQGREQHRSIVFSPWYRVSRTFFRPPVCHSGVTRSRVPPHVSIVPSAKGRPYTLPRYGWKHLRFAPVLSNVCVYADQ